MSLGSHAGKRTFWKLFRIVLQMKPCVEIKPYLKDMPISTKMNHFQVGGVLRQSTCYDTDSWYWQGKVPVGAQLLSSF